MRIVFMGAGDIALPSLRWLLEAPGDHEVVGVFTQPDKPVGRKQVLTPPEVKVIAEASGVPVYQPETLRHNEQALQQLIELKPDLAVVMAYGQILPKAVIEAPAISCVNLHASLLPRHRGASPIQAAIRDGDSDTGITLMHVVPKLDAGDMILKESTPVHPDDTGGILHDRLAELGPIVLERGLPILASAPVPSTPQDEDLVTYSGKLEREDGRIDWSRLAEELERLVRAYDPWPGTFTEITLDGVTKKLKIFPPLRVEDDGDTTPGSVKVTDGTLRIHCGHGSLIVEGDLQMEGRRRLSCDDFLRGVEVPQGTILGNGEIGL